jgi:hypothetical protein
MRRSSVRGLAAVALVLLFAGQADAVPVFGQLMEVDQEANGSMFVTSDDLNCVESSAKPGVYTCMDGGTPFVPGNPAFTWMLPNWNFTLDTDPVVNSAFGFVNTGPTQNFTITVNLPVAPIAPSTKIGGSMGGSITDGGDGLGGLSTVAPTALYRGLIDGVPVGAAADLNNPLSLPFAFASQTLNIPAVFFGLPGPTTPGPAVTTSIGIQNRFNLSTNDSVAMTNTFTVIPEPSTALLLGPALAALALWRRRGC